MRPESRLAEFVTSLGYGDLDDRTVETVRRAFVDTVGVTLAGAVTGAGAVAGASSPVDVESASAGELLGVTGTETPPAAALRVGTAGHALDYDDLSWAMDGHPSVTLVPPLLSLAGEVGAGGRALIAAYAAGFEVECAVAEPISPAHYEAGWHATSTFGTFGAATAAAHLLGLDRAATERALNVAASMPAGTKRNFGSMTKPLHAGLCSRAGVTAARLADGGLSAGHEAISGEGGFWELYDPRRDGGGSVERTVDVGDELALRTEGIHTKAYPCCYFTHAAIAATQALCGDVDPDRIDRIEVDAAGGAGDALTYPEPDTGLEAKFSMEHAVACGAVRDRVGLAAFEDSATDDPGIARVRDRVSFSVEESLPYDSHAATVRVRTGGVTRERRQSDPPGTHDDPLPEAEFRTKFEACAGRALPDDEVGALYETLASLEAVADVAGALASG